MILTAFVTRTQKSNKVKFNCLLKCLFLRVEIAKLLRVFFASNSEKTDNWRVWKRYCSLLLRFLNPIIILICALYQISELRFKIEIIVENSFNGMMFNHSWSLKSLNLNCTKTLSLMLNVTTYLTSSPWFGPF
jgi:hypothetical protein